MLPVSSQATDSRRTLAMIKAVHTAVWLFFVGCIVAIPVATALHHFFLAEVLTGVMLLECLILAVNQGRCPLTDLACRYTDRREANFDIYLPEWLARHNKQVFGSIFVVDVLYLAWQFSR